MVEQSFNNFDISKYKCEIPTKKLVTIEYLNIFQKSLACKEIVQFITELQLSVQNKILLTPDKANEKSKLFITVFNSIEEILKQVPPIQQPMRFGNKAFRTFIDKVKENYENLIHIILGKNNLIAINDEIREYFIDCFGSYERIDYGLINLGTGHELNFLVFLLLLRKTKYFDPSENEQVVSIIFVAYYRLMRKIQLTYMLEPAGSHGVNIIQVWGLDDYCFLPFLFGASQLKDHDSILPGSITNDSIVNKYYSDYLYLDAIKFIKDVKKGVPFAESSPLLHDISGCPNWDKVSRGLIKMYLGEVLNKHPVIKHLRFGSLLVFG